MAKAEKLLIENFSLNDVFKEDFLKKLNELKNNTFPVNVIFINEFEKEGKKQANPLILSHQNTRDVHNKILHLECPDTNLLDSVAEMLEKKEK